VRNRDRTDPVGYKLSSILFSSGSPMAAPDSTTSTIDILANADNSKCPDQCFRPVGLALDAKGRIFMSSDASGEIYVLDKAGASTGAGTGTGTGTGSAATPTSTKKSTGKRWGISGWILGVPFVVVSLLFFW